MEKNGLFVKGGIEINKHFVSALYVVNIIAQSVITLLSPAAIMFFIGWLATSKLSAPSWIYAPLLSVGFLAGLVSMVRFAISASEGLERLEKERKAKSKIRSSKTTNKDSSEQ